jgi:phosphoglycerate dehydrogenase-like enzyme
MPIEVLIYEKEAPAYADAVRRELSDITVHPATTISAAVAAAPSADVIVGLAHEITGELIGAASRLRWVQALTTGTDSLMALPNLPPGLIVTSGRGIHGPQMSEMAFLYMIALSRDFPRMLTNQRSAVWERWPQRLLLGKTAVLLGVGSISEEVAHRCKAFGMRTIGISSGRTEAPGFDEVLPRGRLEEAAALADFLIVLVPLTAETRHIVGRDIIAALPRHAILINLARGDVIDEAALIAALQEKRIAGAGLDVFAVEPPVPDNPLWQMENVIMTPRVGGMSDVYRQQVLPVLLDNLRAYSAGEPTRMRNLVER